MNLGSRGAVRNWVFVKAGDWIAEFEDGGNRMDRYAYRLGRKFAAYLNEHPEAKGKLTLYSGVLDSDYFDLSDRHGGVTRDLIMSYLAGYNSTIAP